MYKLTNQVSHLKACMYYSSDWTTGNVDGEKVYGLYHLSYIHLTYKFYIIVLTLSYSKQ